MKGMLRLIITLCFLCVAGCATGDDTGACYFDHPRGGTTFDDGESFLHPDYRCITWCRCEASEITCSGYPCDCIAGDDYVSPGAQFTVGSKLCTCNTNGTGYSMCIPQPGQSDASNAPDSNAWLDTADSEESGPSRGE